LTEKFAYERRVRESRMRAAMLQAKKSNAEVADLIQQTKIQQIIRAKKRSRETEDPSQGGQQEDEVAKYKRRFRQRDVFQTDGTDKKATDKVLRSLFSAQQ